MYDQKNKMPFCGLEGKLYPTGVKAPKYEYKRKLSDLVLKCSLTQKKYKFSQWLDWWKTPAVQNYVKMGYDLNLETKIQEPFKQRQYGDNLEQVVCFIMRKPFTRKPGMGTFKKVADSIPAMPVQEFAPENAKPVTMEDYKNLDNQREPGDELEEELDDTIPF